MKMIPAALWSPCHQAQTKADSCKKVCGHTNKQQQRRGPVVLAVALSSCRDLTASAAARCWCDAVQLACQIQAWWCHQHQHHLLLLLLRPHRVHLMCAALQLQQVQQQQQVRMLQSSRQQRVKWCGPHT
jgi:hypothetical protein